VTESSRRKDAIICHGMPGIPTAASCCALEGSTPDPRAAAQPQDWT
jgi:hypothetical protein